MQGRSNETEINSPDDRYMYKIAYEQSHTNARSYTFHFTMTLSGNRACIIWFWNTWLIARLVSIVTNTIYTLSRIYHELGNKFYELPI